MGPQFIDLQSTRVPITIPLAFISVFGVIQLALGSDPWIVAMCAIAVATPLLPMHLYGRDLYAMLGLAISMRYTGVALIAKTLYGQTLELNLYDAYTAFGLDVILMVVVTVTLLLARALDPGGAAFPFPANLRSLRKLSVFCFCAGAVAFVIVGSKTSGDGGGSAGSVFVIAASVSELILLAIGAEVFYAVYKSGGRSFLSPVVVFMLVFALVAALALNARGLILHSTIVIFTIAFSYKMLRLRHMIAGVAVLAFFISVLTPITMYLRLQREGVPKSQFVGVVKDTVIRAATDPHYFALIRETAAALSANDQFKVQDFDYYGDRSGVLNRLSFIVLLDAIANGAKTREPLGMEAVNQSLSRNLPGFLGFDKTNVAFSMGDWLSWQNGMGSPGIITFLNFGLPMEGLVTWGLIGFVVYPFILYLALLFAFSRLASFKEISPTSVFFFTILEFDFSEATSEGILATLDREFIVVAAILFLIKMLLFPRDESAQSLNMSSMEGERPKLG